MKRNGFERELVMEKRGEKKKIKVDKKLFPLTNSS
jgi:hypothetical protein